MKTYDLIVIGAGPGGARAAKRAELHGARVALIEKEHAGGVCLNWGCIPTKALCASVSLLEKIKHVDSYGLNATLGPISLANIIKRKASIIETLRNGMDSTLKRSSIDFIKGNAVFTGEKSVAVTNEDGTIHLTAQSIIIATGSSSRAIPILPFDNNRVLDAQSILELSDVPESLAIIGGGAIGCEFASIFNSLGTDVTIIEMQDRLIPLEEAEISKRLGLALKKSGIKIVFQDPVTRVERSEFRVTLHTEKGNSIIVDKVLVAVGRTRNTSGIGLEKVPIALNKDAIIVNDYLETSCKGIYAVGDIIDSPLLAHVATYEGTMAADNAIKGNSVKRDYRVVPNCVFTKPEVASVGLSKEEALKKGIIAEVTKELYSANGKAHCIGEPEGFIKLVFDASSGVIIGGQIMGEGASDLIAEIALAIQYNHTLNDIVHTIHQHPSLAEAIQDAALNAIMKGMKK